jgi:O-acetylhomoserine (thiol)-lyase
MAQPGFTTKSIHGANLQVESMHALRFPIYANAAFDFDSAEVMEDCFNGRSMDFAYSRISNPTVDIYEKKVTALEGGFATVAVASGMAAISTAILNLVQSGDNIVAASSLFGGTYSFFVNVLQPLGIEPRFAPIDNPQAFASAIGERTRVIFLETISNPCILVPDFEAISAIARKSNAVLMADSTVTTPYLFNAKCFGVDVVVHSATKYFSGGATSMGGVIVDMGTFDWTKIPSLRNYHRFKDHAFIARLRKEIYRETGSCLSPHNAYLQTLGLETLSLRMERICRNTQGLAEFLEGRPEVKSVMYSGLISSPFHELAERQFNGLHGGVLSFRLTDKASAFRFLNRLTLIKRATNLGDNKSLAIHPASTIFANLTDEAIKALGVDDTLIRLSVGIEDLDDLIDDIQYAFKGN